MILVCVRSTTSALAYVRMYATNISWLETPPPLSPPLHCCSRTLILFVPDSYFIIVVSPSEGWHWGEPVHSTGYILSRAISPHPPPQQLLHHLILSSTQHNSSETEQIKWSTNFCSHLYDSSSVLCCLVSDGRRGGVSNAAVSDAIWTRHSICFVLQSSACPPSILATHSPVLMLDTIRT